MPNLVQTFLNLVGFNDLPVSATEFRATWAPRALQERLLAGGSRIISNVFSNNPAQPPTPPPPPDESEQPRIRIQIPHAIIHQDERILDMFNLENFDPAIFRQRHRLYSLILMRLAVVYFFAVPNVVRKVFEYTVLAAAIISFGLLVHLHMAFIREPLTCLDHIKDTWPRNGILRVQINGNPLEDGPIRLASEEQIARFILMLETSKWAAYNSTLFPYYVERKFPISPAAHRLVWELNLVSPYDLYRSPTDELSRRLESATNARNMGIYSASDSDLDASKLKPIHYFSNKKNGGWWDDAYVIEYSLEYGLLRLSEAMREHYNVPVTLVTLCPRDDACFGDSLSRFMLKHFLGYDDVLIGSIRRLAETENNRGFVRNVMTGEHFRFVNSWMTRTSYISATFIMIVFTLFISMLIRYSHQQVFVFVSEFLRTLEQQQPFSRITSLLASLATVILALIGIEAIMYEFFADSSIAFHVIIMVWAADQFDSIAFLSAVSRKHFLRFFYLYQWVFYAYHHRFNGQYVGLSLLTTMLFTYHSMIYFFHHCVVAAHLEEEYGTELPPMIVAINNNNNNNNNDPDNDQIGGHDNNPNNAYSSDAQSLEASLADAPIEYSDEGIDAMYFGAPEDGDDAAGSQARQ